MSRHPAAPPTRRSRPVALLFAALLLGCAPALVVRHDPGHAIGDAWALAVYPVYFRFPVTSAEAYQRGLRLAEEASLRSGKLVYGPGEFTVENYDDENIRRATDLGSALPVSKSRPAEGIYALRVRVEQRVGSVSRSYVTPEGAGVKRPEALVDVQVRMQLLSMATRDVVIEVEAETRTDPFSTAVDRDPYPEITILTSALFERVLELAGWEGRARESGLVGRPVPKPALNFSFAGQPSLAEQWKGLDALEQDAKMLAFIRKLDPEADRARTRTYKNAPHGLLVTEAKGPAAAAGLMPGDLVLTVNGEKFTGRYVLDRHLSTGRPATVRYKRDGEEKETTLEAGK